MPLKNYLVLEKNNIASGAAFFRKKVQPRALCHRRANCTIFDHPNQL
jgi:hypothetical protein